MDTRVTERPIPRSLGLLRTCSQIHAETKLLPYIFGTFSSTEFDTLTVFFDSCTPAQREAIRTIEFMVDILFSIWFSRAEYRCLENLSGLRRIDVLVLHVDDKFDQDNWIKERSAKTLRKWKPVSEVTFRAKGKSLKKPCDLLRRRWASLVVICIFWFRLLSFKCWEGTHIAVKVGYSTQLTGPIHLETPSQMAYKLEIPTYILPKDSYVIVARRS